jgi:hypothetical protein
MSLDPNTGLPIADPNAAPPADPNAAPPADPNAAPPADPFAALAAVSPPAEVPNPMTVPVAPAGGTIAPATVPACPVKVGQIVRFDGKPALVTGILARIQRTPVVIVDPETGRTSGGDAMLHADGSPVFGGWAAEISVVAPTHDAVPVEDLETS